MFVTVALVAPVVKVSELAAPGGKLIAVGRITGLAGTYLLLVTLLLIARVPAVERALGQDRLVRLHRRLGPWVLALIGAHVVALTLGNAQQVKSGPLHELGVMVATFPRSSFGTHAAWRSRVAERGYEGGAIVASAMR